MPDPTRKALPPGRSMTTTSTPAHRTHQAGERAFSLDRARKLAEQTLAQAGLHARLHDLDGAWRCHLHRLDDTLAPAGVGAGKGESEQARVGALFEALEHHHSDAHAITAEQLVLRSSQELASEELATDPAIRPLALAPPTPLACRTHTALDGSGAGMDVPVYLHTPSYLSATPHQRRALGDTFDYSTVARYSTNNGTAIGTTDTEAFVHALAETVERDALSMLLSSTFLDPHPAPLRVVDPTSLPEELRQLHTRAQDRSGTSVWLLEMTTDLGIPAFHAYAPARQGHHMVGYGASLCATHAARRALEEFVQVLAIFEHEDHPPPDLAALSRHPALLRAGRADLTPHLASARVLAFTATTAPVSPAGHLAALVRVLTAHGHRPYGRVLHEAANGVSTVSVCVPGLERFFAVTSGQCVVPGPRGRAHMTRAN